MQTVNGALDNSQRFAIDWIKLDDLGRMVAGDPKVLTNWVGYGEPLFAAIDGMVVSTRNDLDDQPPGQLPEPASITAETALGNHVILDIGRGNFLFYAHMQKGSVTVRKGGRVPQGRQLGRLGNSGNTSAPHLHIQVMDSPSALGATGLPYVYRSFTLTGFIDPVKWDAAPDQSGVWGNRGTFKPVKRSHDLPLDLHILDWPER
jgi:murein DD-endopeptidase MepM/ murein hydrolase activator NlpD